MTLYTAHIHTAGKLIALLAVISLVACSPRPKGVLSADKMEDILYQLHRAEGIMYVKGYENGHYDKVAKYHEVVLQQNGITQAQFDSSLVWYTDNPTRFNKIYPKVIDRLTKEKEALVALQEVKQQTQSKLAHKDSITPQVKRSLQEWQQILYQGLPLEWGLDSCPIDTTFIYPYLPQKKATTQSTTITPTNLYQQQIMPTKQARLQKQTPKPVN